MPLAWFKSQGELGETVSAFSCNIIHIYFIYFFKLLLSFNVLYSQFFEFSFSVQFLLYFSKCKKIIQQHYHIPHPIQHIHTLIVKGLDIFLQLTCILPPPPIPAYRFILITNLKSWFELDFWFSFFKEKSLVLYLSVKLFCTILNCSLQNKTKVSMNVLLSSYWT